MKASEPIKERLSIGVLFQKEAGGNFYYRYQIENSRKQISLKTTDYKTAKQQAEKIFKPLVESENLDVLSAHVKAAKSMEGLKTRLPLDKVWKTYDEHPDRANPSTKNVYMEYEREWHSLLSLLPDKQFFDEIDFSDAKAYADGLRKQKLSVYSHGRKLGHLRHILKTLAEYRKGLDNPFDSPVLYRKNSEETNLQTREALSAEQEQELLKNLDDPSRKVRNKEELRLIFLLGIYTGQRLKDCCLLQWHQIDMQGHKISLTQFKTGKKVQLPIAPRLYEALQQRWQNRQDLANPYVSPATAARYNTINAHGKAIGSSLLNEDVLRVIRWVTGENSTKVEGRARAVIRYGFHSLRHSFASHAAELGVSRAVLESLMGAKSDIVEKHYTHVGNEAQEEAMRLIAGDIGVLSPQERIDKVLEYLNTLPEDRITEDMETVRKLLLQENTIS
ncbi:MAG: site-specific integrase [Lentisphaeria bacterium]|nr:site-specific integrase [Lentisphaeria bacterium]